MQKLDYGAVLFDMDGTILDTLADTRAALNHALRSFGFPERSAKQAAAAMGRGIDHLVRSSLPAQTATRKQNFNILQDVIRVYREYYAEHSMDSSRPYDGVPELLSALKAGGAKTAVISNKADEYTKIIADALYPGLLDLAVGEIPGTPMKPDPAPVFSALRALGERPENAVYVGDTEIDMLTAKNAGIACITCAWGLRGKESLLSHGADPRYLADTPADVLRILNMYAEPEQ
ncbi:MAG: HAD family hydrolase [Oscillospiraceae bacterium]|jgi:phosphoglycolate phosphatase|nr:HAD family hydrolase [Oscillospiraceae bacterium]